MDESTPEAPPAEVEIITSPPSTAEDRKRAEELRNEHLAEGALEWLEGEYLSRMLGHEEFIEQDLPYTEGPYVRNIMQALLKGIRYSEGTSYEDAVQQFKRASEVAKQMVLKRGLSETHELPIELGPVKLRGVTLQKLNHLALAKPSQLQPVGKAIAVGRSVRS